jgi:hypothetical protein
MDDRVLIEHKEMAKGCFLALSRLLGTNVDCNHTLDFSLLIESQDLQDLDEAFFLEEIWNAVKRLPARKAPRPVDLRLNCYALAWAQSNKTSLTCSSN